MTFSQRGHEEDRNQTSLSHLATDRLPDQCSWTPGVGRRPVAAPHWPHPVPLGSQSHGPCLPTKGAWAGLQLSVEHLLAPEALGLNPSAAK